GFNEAVFACRFVLPHAGLGAAMRGKAGIGRSWRVKAGICEYVRHGCRGPEKHYTFQLAAARFPIFFRNIASVNQSPLPCIYISLVAWWINGHRSI
ncbi:MAG: hypothetical protein LUC23_00435, partial [Prevotellaceae bacterium]|nr:hypothetical protein [Prevotellaceae bacterium]